MSILHTKYASRVLHRRGIATFPAPTFSFSCAPAMHTLLADVEMLNMGMWWSSQGLADPDRHDGYVLFGNHGLSPPDQLLHLL